MAARGGPRRLGAVAVVLSLAAAGCTSTHSLRARKAVTGTGVVDASATAVLPGKRVALMLPSGRVDLVVTAPQRRIPAESVDNAAPLVAAKGQVLVGVSWQLQRAAFPDSQNRQLLGPDPAFGDPQPVNLWLVTDGTRHAIPRLETLTAPIGRPSNAVWVSVPAGVRTWQVQLGYDGLTQTVDARTGKVEAGRAAPLYRPLPLHTNGTCALAGRNVLTSCLTDYAIGYPYVGGSGWAPAGKTWALLQIVMEDDFHGARAVTVAGGKPGPEVGDRVEPYSPFLVPSGAVVLPVHGKVAAKDLYRGTVRVSLTAELSRSVS
jgi:hypothetical protein